jgi:hypothetical protein
MSQQATQQVDVEFPSQNGASDQASEQELTSQPLTAAPPQPKKYIASIYPQHSLPIPATFAENIQELERSLGMPLWLLIHDQGAGGKYDDINEEVRKGFWLARNQMPKDSPIALLIDSPGGFAQSAYQIATLIRHRCGEFTAVIPRYAKSAATLLTLGASNIILNTDAELGPLDVQILDYDREEHTSALNEVQILERLHAAGLDALDQTMMLLALRTRKKLDTILPHTLKFVADMMRPMFEKVDVVHYTQRARELKVAEEYATKLLKPKYSKEAATSIARHLVEKYPEHEFVIDVEETNDPNPGGLNLQTEQPSEAQANLMDGLVPYLGGLTIIGQLREENQP